MCDGTSVNLLLSGISSLALTGCLDNASAGLHFPGRYTMSKSNNLIQFRCPSFFYRSNFSCFKVNKRVGIRDDRELPTHQVLAKFVRYWPFQCQHLKLHATIASSIFLRGLQYATRVGNHTDVPVFLLL